MSRAPWDADHSVEEQQFARILERRFPEFREPVVEALPHGWDYLTFRVDEDWVFKIPKRASVVSRMRQEVSLLTALPKMPAAVPRPAFHGVAADDLPHPFFGYPWLDGVFATDPAVDPDHVLPQALAFLEALHAIDPPFAVEGWRDGTWTSRVARLGQVVERVPELTAAFQWLQRNVPEPPRKTLLHDDLGPEHLLLHPETHDLIAVLDWADAARGDPARDLVSLLLWEPVATASAHRARGGTEDHLRRAYAHALLTGLQILKDHLRWGERAEIATWTASLLRVQEAIAG